MNLVTLIDYNICRSINSPLDRSHQYVGIDLFAMSSWVEHVSSICLGCPYSAVMHINRSKEIWIISGMEVNRSAFLSIDFNLREYIPYSS